LTAAQEPEKQEQHGFFTGLQSLDFGPPAELLVDPFERVGGPRRFLLRAGGSGVKSLLTGLLEADADRLTAKFPLAQEAHARSSSHNSKGTGRLG
jgi:hypothetical protein